MATSHNPSSHELGTQTPPETTPAQTIVDEENGVEKSESLPPPAPDGGLQAWLAAAGGACLFFCCLGFANSFGAFEQYYLTHNLRGESPSKIAWIGSVSAFAQFAAGVLGGPLFDRYGVWVS